MASIKAEPHSPSGGTWPITWTCNCPIDHDLLDRPLTGPHPLGDPRTFEGRPGRGRGGRELAVGQEHDLAVGADIDQEGRARAIGQPRRQDAADDVAAHESADDRQDVDPAARMDLQAAFRGRKGQPLLDRGHEGHFAQRPRIDAAEELLHRGIAGQGHVVDLLPGDARGVAQFADHLVDGLDDDPLELFQPVGTGAGHENSRQHVVAEAGLRIEPRSDADLPAGGQVQQGGNERRGAQVDGHAKGIPLRVSRLEVDEAVVVQHGGALEIGVPQAAGKLADQAQIGLNRAEAAVAAGPGPAASSPRSGRGSST